ncbi:unnamed protein product [Calicophoron daubneyi]|uniref:Multidrug and toxin extrusion protein n=1 Tax=Calicophoron daubneyi TaxID=300641 RepID=A0AAV2TCS5_CALDB
MAKDEGKLLRKPSLVIQAFPTDGQYRNSAENSKEKINKLHNECLYISHRRESRKLCPAEHNYVSVRGTGTAAHRPKKTTESTKSQTVPACKRTDYIGEKMYSSDGEGEFDEDSASETQRLISPEDLEVEVQAIEIPEVVHTGWLGRFFPFGFWYEFKKLIQLAVPIAITSVIAFLSGPISVIFCGRLGKSALATVGLAVSVFNVTGLSVITGLLSAADTLFAQTYGSDSKHLMGVQLQRFCCLWAITYEIRSNTESRLPSYGDWASYKRPKRFVSLLVALCGADRSKFQPFSSSEPLPYCRGSAIAQVLSYVFQSICLLFYILYLERSGITWKGWSNKLWLDWGMWFKLALPGVFMTTLEWTIFEIGTIVAGTIGEKELATQAILFNIESICYTLLPLGFGMATSIRLGQFLGARSAVGPRSVLSVALVTLWAASIVFVLLMVLLRHEIPKIFTDDKGVIDLAAQLLPIIAAFQIFDGTVGVCSGAIRGAGLQVVGALVCFLTLYVLGAPVGLCLVFLAGYGLEGIWGGMTLGTVTEGLTYCIICQCINWEKQVLMAIKRTSDRDEMPPVQDYSNTRSDEEFDSSSDTCIDALSESQGVKKRRSLAVDILNSPNLGESSRCLVQLDDPKTRSTSGLRSILLFRIILIVIVTSVFVGSICCRILFKWSDYFGFYCVYPNETFISMSSPDAFQGENCTFVIP